VHKTDFISQLFPISNLTFYSCYPKPINCHIPTSAPAITFVHLIAFLHFKHNTLPISLLSLSWFIVWCPVCTQMISITWVRWTWTIESKINEGYWHGCGMFVYKCFLPAAIEEGLEGEKGGQVICGCNYYIISRISHCAPYHMGSKPKMVDG